MLCLEYIIPDRLISNGPRNQSKNFIMMWIVFPLLSYIVMRCVYFLSKIFLCIKMRYGLAFLKADIYICRALLKLGIFKPWNTLTLTPEYLIPWEYIVRLKLSCGVLVMPFHLFTSFCSALYSFSLLM